MNVAEMENLKKRLEEAGKQYERNVGRLNQLETQLKDQFGFESVAEASKHLIELKEEIANTDKQLDELSETIKAELNKYEANA